MIGWVLFTGYVAYVTISHVCFGVVTVMVTVTVTVMVARVDSGTMRRLQCV